MSKLRRICPPLEGEGVLFQLPPSEKLSEETARLVADPKRIRARERVKKWASKHKEYNRTRARIYLILNREKLAKKQREYLSKNRERSRIVHRKWIAKNREHRLAYRRMLRKKYPRRYRASDARAKAKRRGAEVFDPKVSALIQQWKSEKTFRCYYCEKTFPIAKLQVDHVLAITKGGKHTLDNICKACPFCNPSKSAKLIQDFAPNGQMLMI